MHEIGRLCFVFKGGGKKKKKAHFEPGTETVFLFIDAHWQLRVHAVSLVLQPVT